MRRETILNEGCCESFHHMFCTECVFMCAWFFAFVDSLVADRIVMAAWMLYGLRFGRKPGAGNLVFFRVKWLRPAMKGTSCARRVRLRSRRARLVPVFCNKWLFMRA